MAFPIEDKLVIGVASSALFDLSESNRIFEEQGVESYRKYQQENIDVALNKGVAFPFIRRFLSINNLFPEECPVEVVLLSRNSPETGLRVFRSIDNYGLDITRAAFMGGGFPHEFIQAFNASLFLSAHAPDVNYAIENGLPAGLVLPGNETIDDESDGDLRVAFDFDGVIADDESEAVYKNNNLDEFVNHEKLKQEIPHSPGPLADLFRKLSKLQQLQKKLATDNPYQQKLKISIVTARGAPSHERVLTTLKDWGVDVDSAFFLGGMEKSRILEVMKPHIFFDDQLSHLVPSKDTIPMVHIPFGISNRSD